MAERRYHPSIETGIGDITPQQRELLLDYLAALMEAKAAGVAGEAVKVPQRYIDHVARERIADASDPMRWAERDREMRLEMEHWRLRIADHRRRQARQNDPGVTGGSDVVVLLDRIEAATREQLDEVERVASELREFEIREIRELWPDARRPDMATLARRGVQRTKDMVRYDLLQRQMTPFRIGVRYALVGAFAGEQLPPLMRAALLGPWVAVMDGDRSLVDAARSSEARRMRRDLLTFPKEALETAEETERRRLDALDDLPF
jgi:hypothetical protein